MVDWRKLPVEMWGEIGQRLVSRLDVERFKAACKECRSSLPSRSRFPLWVPPLPDHSDLPTNAPYFITEVNLYSVELVGSDRRVLMEFEELDKGIEINSFVPHEVKGIDFLYERWRNKQHGPRQRLAFVAKAYRLHTAIPPGPSIMSRCKRWQLRCISERVSKTVLISSNSNNVVANCRADQSSYALSSCDHLSVVAQFVRGGKLAILRLGGSQHPNWGWDWVIPQQVVYEDIATYKGRLCAIDGKGRAFLMDYHSLQMTQVAAAPPTTLTLSSSSVQLFSNALGELYLVITYMNMNGPKVDVKVFKLSGRLRCEWLEVDRHTAGTQVFLRAMGYKVSLPRDVVAGDYWSWMMECKSSRDRGVASLLVLPLPLQEEDHMGDDDNNTSCSFIYLGLNSIPWFLWGGVAPTAPSNNTSTTSIILNLYDNRIVGRRNVLHLLARPPPPPADPEYICPPPYYSTPDALRAIAIYDVNDLISFACFLLTLFVFLYIFLFDRR